MNSGLKRFISIMLVLSLIFSLSPVNALAYYAQKTGALQITDSAGELITADESWDEVFPYGTFAFESSEVTISEDGPSKTIKVYRLGGTIGRASAFITYMPAISQIEEGVYTYANAAGANDLIIEVEDALPIAMYQPLGIAPYPMAWDSPLPVLINEELSTENIYGDDELVSEFGDLVIYIDIEALSYQWYVKNDDSWQIISDADSNTFTVSQEHRDDYDFRCVFTTADGLFSSDSLKGETYIEPEAEILPDLPPEGVDLNPEITYSRLEMDAGEFDGYVFEMVFAEDEWVKEIIVTALDDDISEADEFGLFTIAGHKGASLYDTANTLTLRIEDNDTILPSYLAFETDQSNVDKSDGYAYIKVIRSGAMQYVVSVDYTTLDLTAKAGVDYVKTSGTLFFYGDINEMTIKVPLINDTDHSEYLKSFVLSLSDIKGGGEDSEITAGIMSVYLNNSDSATQKNVATILYDKSVMDLSGSVTDASGSLTGITGNLKAEEIKYEPEYLYAEYTPAKEMDPDDINLMTYTYPTGALSFIRPSQAATANKYWRNFAYVANQFGTYSGYDVNDVSSYMANSASLWSAGSRYHSLGWMLASKGHADASLTVSNMDQLFSSFRGSFRWRPHFASSWTLTWYGLEYVYPGFTMQTSANTNHYYYSSVINVTGGYWSGYTINYYPSSYHSIDWAQNSNVNKINLFTRRYDSQNSEYDAVAALADGVLQRRVFSQPRLNLRIFTANDADIASSGIATFSTDSNVYGSIKPEVRIKEGYGGVTTGNPGSIYVGSQLEVLLKKTAAYSVPSIDGNLNNSVFLTNSSGTLVKHSTGNQDIRNIEMLWSGMNLSDAYTVNVIMNRTQTVELDLAPSVPRLMSSDGTVMANIDTERISEALDSFKSSGLPDATKITYGYHSPNATTEKRFVFREDGEISKTGLELVSENTTAIKMPPIENLQWICFNLSGEDIVLFNGVAYAGNEKIYLTVNMLAEPLLTFRYYNKDYITAQNVMTTSISRTALYLDTNGNGQIDGIYNKETGYFDLTEVNGIKDEFIGYLKDIDYEETIFAPVYSESANKYVDHFLKVFYTMTPRSIVVPTGSTENDTAQVMPAFTTNVTNPQKHSMLTAEQKSYRYILSGKSQKDETSGYTYSADSHLMYTAAASVVNTIDIPLGGDYSPAVLNEATGHYEWSPHYIGNLISGFDNPSPIYIANSLAGSNIPIAEITGLDINGDPIYETGGVDKLNGYLGSYAGESTFVICVREQHHTTEEILSSANDPDFASSVYESSTISTSGTFPSAEYLKLLNEGADSPGGDVDMGGSGNDYSEFNVDIGIELPKMDIKASDYITIIMDGYDIGFSIGLPLGSVGTENKGFGDTNKESADKLRNFFSGNWSDFATDDTFKGMSDEKNKLKSSNFSVKFAVGMAFMFKYNALDNTYYFSEFAVYVEAELEFRYQYRFTPVPIVYVYVAVGIKVKLSTGISVERVVIEGNSPLAVTGNLTGSAGNVLSFDTTLKTFNMYFEGKVLIECTDSFGLPVPGITNGYINSDGQKPVTVTLTQQDGYTLFEPISVKLTYLSDSTLRKIMPVTSAETNTYWSGFKLAPEAFIEAGAGIGVEMLKFEIFVKISIGCEMTFGAYTGKTPESDGEYEAFVFNKFEFSLGLGFRVVLLLFSFEMDLIKYLITYDGNTDKWQHGWSALGGMFGEMYDLSDNPSMVSVKPPRSTFGSQQIYKPGDPNSLSAFAYDPSDPANVPFQLSGYSSSADAFKLVDGLVTGYDYEIITVGADNYIIYTISRDLALNPVDLSMLVMSRLKLTGETYGLVNPADEDALIPYVILDNDGTGDLEFDAWVDNDLIHAAWVSYASVSEAMPVMPSEPVGHIKPDGMDVGNYNNETLFPIPSEPAEVLEPDLVSEPVESDYYNSELEPQPPYTTYEEASEAYESDMTAYIEYLNALSQYLAYQQALLEYSAFYAWYTYFTALDNYNSYISSQAAIASRNTVVKTASFDTQSDTEFGTATVISGPEGNNVFLPITKNSGDVVFYASTNHYSEAELLLTNNSYNEYLEAKFGLDSIFADSFKDYLYEYKTASNSIYGKSSSLHLSFMHEDVWVSAPEIIPGDNKVIENMEILKSDDNTYYVAYTTSESYYINKDDNVITSGFDQDTDMVTIMNLYLRDVTINGNEASWGSPRLLRTNVDYDRANHRDGLYSGSAMVNAHTDPYFSNLQFLYANLDDSSGMQNFLLFEMNGNTYLIDQNSLLSIINEGTGQIIPFFTNDEFNSATGKAYVTIGADGAGNISAVYTASVEHTTNNALFVTKYDSKTGTWGDGRMLAMKYMQVYEDSFGSGWNVGETESAYLGRHSDYPGGGMDQFLFTNLQIALGQPANDQDPGTLLVISEGSLTKLQEVSYTVKIDGEDRTDNTIIADGDGSVGFYALSFGVGDQGIGEVSLRFADHRFSAGSILEPSLSFVNTGDIGIRGSTSEPVTVELWVSDAPIIDPDDSTVYYPIGNMLNQWSVTENIAVGQKVTMSGICDALYKNLESGSVFYIVVYEDQEYTDNPFIYSTLHDGGNFTVQDKTELGFESSEIRIMNIDQNGDTNLYVDMHVGNRGTKNAEEVYIQFSYQVSIDENGKAVYAPIDLTGHNLSISRQEPLIVQSQISQLELGAGILRLYNEFDGDGLDIDMGRTIKGTINVPSSYYYSQGITGSMNIKAEIFSSDSVMSAFNAGIVDADHDEYNTMNNISYFQIEHTTYFGTADRVTLPLGTTMRLPVGISTTTGEPPVITVTEILDAGNGLVENHLGILYYQPSGSYVVMTPVREGSGFIRIADTSTNSFKDIAFTVTQSGMGINIFDNNDLFEFYPADNWIFKSSVPVWGPNDDVPYLFDLSYGIKETYFTFESVSSSIDLYFEGGIEVTSTFPNFTKQTFDSAGGETPVRISFGDNPTYYTHTITIKIKSDFAQFDRYIEYFTGVVPTPADDTISPQIYWSRSFPETASIESNQGEEVVLTCYVIDESGLASVSLNGMTPANLVVNDSGFWQFDIVIDSNTSHTVSAFDKSTNFTTRTILIDWFNPVVGIGAIADAPYLDVWFEYEDKTPVPSDVDFLDAYTQVYLDFDTDLLNESSVNYYNSSTAAFDEFLPDISNRYFIERNGYYQVISYDQNGKWSNVILYMGKIDISVPQLVLEEKLPVPQTGRALSYNITKDQSSPTPIVSAKINGKPLAIPLGQTSLAGEYMLYYAGLYTLYAEDGAENHSATSVLIDNFAINLEGEEVFEIIDSWNQEKDNGALIIDPSKITGGLYVADDLNPDGTGYRGSYEFALVSSDSDEKIWDTNTEIHGLSPGNYTVYVRDAQDENNESIISSYAFSIEDKAVHFTVSVKGAQLSIKGLIVVSPFGGYSETGIYEFAIIKHATKNDELIAAKDIDEWYEADDIFTIKPFKTFDELDSGWYQIIVRETGLDYSDPTNFDNAASEMVNVPYITMYGVFIEPSDFKYEDGKVKVFLSALKKILSFAAIAKLITDNETMDILINGNGIFVLIPKGTLNPGDNISDMLVLFDESNKFENGVVQFTSNDGNKHLVYMSILTGSGVYYIAQKPGVYEIIDNPKDFDDINGHWAEGYIKFAASHGLFEGTADAVFEPNTGMTRAMVATVLGRMAGADTSLYKENIFTDTLAGSWYAPYVTWAYENDIMQGYGQGRFGPDDIVTREQLCVILLRFMDHLGFEIPITGEVEDFADKDKTSPWALSSVHAIKELGIIQGVGGNIFDPSGKSNRATVATILNRFIEAVLNYFCID